MRIHLIRHADPDYEADSLTPAGHLEADALSKRVAALHPTHLYVSALGRAQATAAPIAAATGRPPITDARLDELGWHVDDPRRGLLSAWDVPGEDVRTTTEPFTTRPFEAGISEIRAFSDELLDRHGYRREGGRYAITRRSDDRLAVVCHGGLLLTWIPHLLDLPVDRFWCGFWLPPSSLTTIVLEERSDRWATPRCTALADLSHLARSGLPPSAAGRQGRGHD